MKKDTHIVLIRRFTTDDFPRWELVNFAPSQKAADAIAQHPIDQQGNEVDVRLGDLLATGKMEIVQPDEMAQYAKLFFKIDKGVHLDRRSLTRLEPSIIEAPKFYRRSTSMVLGRDQKQKKTWLETWEGESSNAYTMALYCGDVPWRRVTSAACAIAASISGNIKRDDVREVVLDYLSSALSKTERKPQTESEKKIERALIEACNKIFNPKDVFAITSATEAVSTTFLHNDPSSRLCETVDAAGRSMGSNHVSSPLGNMAELKQLAIIVREHIPLPALLCSMVGASDPVPMARENPRRRR